jgi:membrane associated rhomboid family serine protease
MRQLSLVAARGAGQIGWLTHMFLHFGWLHILGNLFFFYLVGPLLEDVWGRRFFGAFYLAGGLFAALAHFGMDPHSRIVMAGASGAIAACMGAFSWRCAHRRIRMAYWIGWFWRGTFLMRAWLWGGFWFASEVLSLALNASEGVAVMAHVGGFAFAFLAAVAIEKSGYEAKNLAPAVQGATTWSQHPGTDAARAALERARGEYQPMLLEAVSYRLRGHSVVDPAKYRSREETERLRALDPVPAYRNQLIQAGLLDDDAARRIEEQAEEQVDAAVAFADASPDPDPGQLFEHAYATAVPNIPHQLPGDPVVPWPAP